MISLIQELISTLHVICLLYRAFQEWPVHPTQGEGAELSWGSVTLVYRQANAYPALYLLLCRVIPC